MAHEIKRSRIHIVLLSICMCFVPITARAQATPETPSQSGVSCISPYYFGPNAFPVPNIVYKVSEDLRIEIAGDYFKGRRGDVVYDIALKANIPLFTPRVNLSLWIPAMEWYRNSELNMNICRVPAENRKHARRGSMAGDAYVSVDIQVLAEGRYLPDAVIRAAIKSASGGGYSLARYYDSPGYFFDAAIAKSFLIIKPCQLRLRVAATSGFLCWQTGAGRQNDAVRFGALLNLYTRRWSVTESFAGYAGWENSISSAAHDRPMVLTSEIAYHIKQFELLASFCHGFTDYPYDQFRIGMAYHLNILGKR